MRIIELRAENFKRLRAVEISPDENLVEIRGRNGAGKSSVLDAIWGLFAGAAALPPRPVRAGAERAVISARVGDRKVEYVVTRQIGADGATALTVAAPSGARFPSPQAVLNGLVGAIAFDPLEFARARPRDQLEALRRVVPLDVDLDALAAEDRRDYEARAAANRDAARAAGAAAGIAVPPDLPMESIDLTALAQEMRAAIETNAAVECELVDRQRKVRDMDTLRQNADDHEKEAERHRKLAIDLRLRAAAEDKALAALPPLAASVDVVALAEAIRRGQEVNAGVAARAHRVGLEAEAAAARARSGGLTAAMEERRRVREAALARARFPVPGLAFGEAGVMYAGVPFEQASAAERIRVSAAVAMAANPRLRVLCVRDGSVLDREGFAALAAAARGNGYQLWIEVTDDGEGAAGVVIEDGVVRGAAPTADGDG